MAVAVAKVMRFAAAMSFLVGLFSLFFLFSNSLCNVPFLILLRIFLSDRPKARPSNPVAPAAM